MFQELKKSVYCCSSVASLVLNGDCCLPPCLVHCCRDKTPEEADMQKEVEELRVKLDGLKELTPGETDTINELAGELDDKEKALYKLQVRCLVWVCMWCGSSWRCAGCDGQGHSRCS
eukprot:GHRQ01029109.1.p1 GENE.GHRQ01029109.1~~GHRQ01029109.1.p1  ORF type:complete len:117 (-),score=45.81 GHRQ01029109.1:126-476(-)